MIKLQMYCFALVLSILGIHLIEFSTSSTSARHFQFQSNPRRGPVRLGKPWLAKSRQVCARSCMERYANCTSFLYNRSTGLCTPGSYINEKQPLPSPAEGDFFQSFFCDTAKGFSVRTVRNTTACAGLFGPATYEQADAACQRKGGYLISTRTRGKFEILVSLAANKTSSKQVWVGCDDKAREGQFIWKADGLLLTETERVLFFSTGEPNDAGGGEDCILYIKKRKRLYDAPCSYTYHYACEVPYG